MKKTHRIELLNTIKSTKVSFVSIVFFVALAVAVFVGLSWTGDETRLAIDRQMEDAHYYDLELIFPYGFTNNDIRQISEFEGVDEIDVSRIAYGTINYDGSDYQVKIHQLGGSITTPVVVRGRMPERSGEVAIKDSFASSLGICVGDSITVRNNEIVDGSKLNKLMKIDPGSIDADEADDIEEGYLNTDTFKVTALVNSMQYIMNIPSTYGSTPNGAQSVDGLLYVVGEDMRDSAFSGYTNVYIRSNSLRGLNTYSSEYKDRCLELKNSLKKEILDITTARYEAIRDKADETTASIDRKLDKALNEIGNGEDALQDAEGQLHDALQHRKKLAAAVAAIEEQLRNLHEDSELEQTDNTAYLLYEGELEDRLQDSRDALSKLDKLIATLNKHINQGKNELDKLDEEYYRGLDKANDFNEAVDELTEYDCLIATREYNIGLTSLEIVCECVDELKYSMALLFLIVGLLVCYSAVSRIVYSQSTRIGTKKALGMKDAEINSFYFAYSGLAAIIGCLIGLLLGAFFVERVVLSSLADQYLLYSAKVHVNWLTSLTIIVVEAGLILVSTWLACYKTLKQDAVNLLSGQTTQHNRVRFYEKSGLWKNRSLLSKTIVNNCINDKRRVFATLVGIAGCTAMIVCAIMLKDNIVLGIQKQYDELFGFNEIVMFEDDNQETAEQVGAAIEEAGIKYAFIKKDVATMSLPDNKQIGLDVFTSTDPQFYDLIRINRVGDADGSTREGVWIHEAYAEEYGTKAGDTVELMDSNQEVHRLEVTGFMECYLTRGLAIISPEVYEEEFGKKPISNAALVSVDNNQETALLDRLDDIEGFYNINDYYEVSYNFFTAFTSISGALVAVYLVLAVIMTLLVLLNLFVMFVEEKRIELIVMMINGFDVKAAKSYIYSDTILIGIVGIVIGALFGTLMGKQTISSFENAATVMIKTTDVAACLIAAAVTAVLTTIMVVIAMRPIGSFELSDINRE